MSVVVDGNLDSAALRSSISEVVRQSEMLHTKFSRLPGMAVPLQVVCDPEPPLIEPLNLCGMNQAEQQAAIDALLEEARREWFVLDRGQFLRISQIELAERKHLLIMTLPALCIDTTGLRSLAALISRSYAAALRGEELLDVSIPYTDISRILSDMLESDDGEVGRQYWRRKDIPDFQAVKLPMERHPSTTEAFDPRQLSMAVGPSVVNDVRSLCQGYGVSIDVFLLAGWAVLLFRLTAQSDVPIGVAYDGRTYSELKDTLGLFAKYLPILCHLQENTRFSEVLKTLDESTREAQDYQDYFSFDQATGPGGGSLGPGFFPLSFGFEPEPSKHLATGLTFSIRDLYACFDKFKVQLFCRNRNGGIVTDLRYDAVLFKASDIERTGLQYHRLLESVCMHPEAEIADLEILSVIEKHQILIEFNNAGLGYSLDKCIHQLVQEQAEQTPDRIAVLFEHEHLSYSQLDSRSNRLAHQLTGQGVAPDVLVGVCMERSLEMIIGLLGILKAGGAYVPLDPGYPKDRIAFMVEDAGIALLLTDHRRSRDLPEQSVVISVDKEVRELAGTEECDVCSAATPDSLAYVIYTSGSTGKPKAVQISHRSICNRLLWMIGTLPLTKDDNFFQKTPISFDASVWEFYVPLFSGAKVIMARPGGHQDASYLVRSIVEERATILQLVPSMLRVFLEEEGVWKCRSLRLVFCGGEVLPSDTQEEFFTRIDAGLINLYGPTEVSIDATFWPCPKEGHGQVVPIGRPIGNMQVYSLDPRSRPVPVGVPGELHIGGVGLARGYLNRADLTSDRFIPNLFSHHPGARSYKSGDLGRHLPDGIIEFLGRTDHQVKIRGFRIELGEIEAVLRQCVGVKGAVVLVHGDSGADRRLVAYVEPEGGRRPTTDDLTAFLQERLPAYMVPSSLLALDSFPVSPNGKVDRRALREFGEKFKHQQSRVCPAPRNAIEELLVGIWADVLGVDQPSIHDDFFQSGGHSLIAGRLISRIRETFQIELPLRAIFESPTIAAVGQRITIQRANHLQSQTPPISALRREGPFPLSYAQQRLWFLDQLEPGSATYNIAMAVRLEGRLNVDALRWSVNRVVERHEALRTCFATVGGRPVQVIKGFAPFELPMVDLSVGEEGGRQERAIGRVNQLATEGFDLARGPMLRVELIKLSEGEHIMTIVMHHIVSDGWSSDVMVREVARLYESYNLEEEAELEELTIQYADYAVWQREWLKGEVLEEQLSYWKGQLEGADWEMELPTDRGSGLEASRRGGTERFEIGEQEYRGLRSLSQRAGVTMFMTLLAAFDTLLYRYTGREDIIVGTDVSNRARIETEGLIGFFVNQLVLRTDVSGNPRFADLLIRVREIALGAYANQDLPFVSLVQMLKPDRSLSRAPLIQVKLLLQNATARPTTLANLKMSILETQRKTAQLPLIMDLLDNGQEIIGSIDYDADRFDASAIARMANHFQNLIASILADPSHRISDLRMLSDTETAGYVPSDFPQADLNLAEFEQLILEISKPAVKTPGY
jgi:amino acid adenylation domain-containing protein